MAWSREEVEAIVADYLQMLTMHLTGQQYNKTAHRRSLSRYLNNRSEGAIEFKHQNISAVLNELGCFYIPGYKPRGNYQDLLFEVVSERMKNDEVFDSAALAAAQMPAVASLPEDFSNIVVEPPRLHHRAGEPGNPRNRFAVKRDYVGREAHNTSLGLAGEEFVLHFERWALISRGQERLANKVNHVSKTQGDGLGYDILSFDIRGQEKLIEVKTTSFGKETPFFVTKSEVDLSRTQPEQFHLYRLFEFREDPHLFTFRGPINDHCHLDPMTFHARFS